MLRWVRTGAAVTAALLLAAVTVLLLGGLASASSLVPSGETLCEGSQVWAQSPAELALTQTAAGSCVTAGSARVFIQPAQSWATGVVQLCVFASDPRQLTGWPQAQVQTSAARCEQGALPAPDADGWTQTLSSMVLGQSGAEPWVAAFDGQASTSPARALWSMAAATPTSSASPTSATSGAPASSTTSVPSTAAPTATTTAAPTTTQATPTPGSCTTEAPCVVSLAPGQTVSAGLIDGQWSQVLLALGSLVFFSAASFVAGWRSGRSS